VPRYLTADESVTDIRLRRPDRARAVGDNEHIELEACCYTVDLLPHRARIGINVNIGQLPAYFQLSSRLFIGTGPTLWSITFK